MRRGLATGVVLALSACTSAAVEDPYLHPELDAAHPATALADHVLSDYFASELADGTSTCVAETDGREPVALAFDEEARLMARYISLVPFSACAQIDGKWIDVESRTAAHVIEIHSLSCASAARCTAFVRQSRWDANGPEERFSLAFEDGRWDIINRGVFR